MKLKLLSIFFTFIVIQKGFALINPPNLVSPSNLATGQATNVLLDWSFVSSSGYNLQRDINPNFNSPQRYNGFITGISEASSANLNYNTTYYWRVRCYNTGDTSAWSTVWSFTTINTLALYTPTNGATNVATSVNLDWAATSGVSGYLFQYDVSPNFNSASLFSGNAGTVSDVTVNNLFYNTTYYWRIRVYNNADTSGWSSVWSFTTLNSLALYTPTNTSTNIATSVNLDWAATTGVSGYLYQYDLNPNFNSPSLYSSNAGTVSDVTINNLLYNTTYYWRIRVYNNADTSGWSTIWSFTTLNSLALYTPTNTSTNVATSVNLDWAATTGVSGYLYQYDVNPNFNSPSLYSGNAGTISDVTINSLLYNTTYYWRIRVYNNSDTSGWSTVWSFTTLNSLALYSPTNTSTNVATSVNLDWAATSGISGYLYQYDVNPNFNSPSLFSSNAGTISDVTVNNLNYNTTYYWRIRVYNSVDTSGWSTVWSFTTISQINLNTPSNNASSTATSLNLDWSSSSGTSGYLYQVDTSPIFNTSTLITGNTGTTSDVTLSNLLFNTTYYWRVRMINSNDTSAWSTIWSFTTLNKLIVTAPAINAIGQAVNNLVLDWNSTTGIQGYQYQYAIDSAFTNTFISTLTGTSSQVTISSLFYGTMYFWRVRAFNLNDTSNWSNVWYFTTNYQMTSAPVLVSPTNGATGVALSGTTLQINSVPNATGYQYQYANNSGFVNATNVNSSGLTNATAGFSGNTTYYWRARAYNNSGNSPWAAPYTFTTVPGPPPAPIPSYPTNTSTGLPFSGININWIAVSGATNYVIMIDDNSAFSSPTSNNISTNSFATGTLLPATTYYWQVQAINGNGNSSFSTTYSFTTAPLSSPILSLPSDASAAVAIIGTSLAWSSVTGATSYHYEYSTTPNFSTAISGTTSNLNYLLPQLLNNTTYYWHVYSSVSGINSNYSATYSFTTEVVATPNLLLPTNNATGISISGATIAWSAVSNATSYYYEIDDDVNFGSAISGTTTNLTAFTGALNYNTTYYWHVYTTINGINSIYSITGSFTTVAAGVAPTASFAFASATICANSSINFTNTSNGALTYSWTFQNGSPSISTAENPVVSFASAGNKLVTLIVTNNFGSDTISQIINVVGLPTASNITAMSATTFCAGGSVMLMGNVGGVWSNNSTTANITVTASGIYNVTNTNVCGSTTSNSMTVTVNQPPTAAVISANGPTTFCEGNSVVLQSNSIGTWSNGATTSSITVNQAGTYTVVNTNNCGSVTSNNIIVTVNPLPTPSVISANGSTSFCSGGFIGIGGNIGGVWNTGSTIGVITVTQSGTYYVTNTNSCGSVNSNSITVTVSNAPVASTISAVGATTFCEGNSVILNGNNAGTWSNGSTSSSITVTQSGSYSVATTNACGTTTSNVITVSVNPLPIPNVISALGSTTLCSGATVTLNGNNGGVWSTGSTTSSIIVSQSGNFTVTNTNSCGSVTSNTIAVIVELAPTPSIIAAQNVLNVDSAIYASYQWQLNNVNILGANSSSYTATQTGNYSVVVTSGNGCIGTSPTEYILITSVYENNSLSNLAIFPNPASDKISIVGAAQQMITIHNTLGEVVYSQKITNSFEIIDVSSFRSGVYSVTVNNHSNKFIKN